MDIIHRAGEVMKFRTCLTTLRKLALQPTQDMIKRQLALPRDPDIPTSHPTHTSKNLRLHIEFPTSCPLHSERETLGSICLRGLASADSRHEQSAEEGGLFNSMLGMLLLELLVLLILFGADGDMGILFGEDAEDVGDDFAVGCPRLRCRFRIPWLRGK